MNRLLMANFARLKKDKVFWIGMAFMFAAGIFGIVQTHLNDPKATPDQLVFIYPVLIGIVMAAFCSLYIGTEYSDGTIRNKLMVGHRRPYIYLANFITCSLAGMVMCLVYIVAVTAVGIPILGNLTMKPKGIMILFLVSLMMVIACAALFSLFCMLNQNKAVAAVVCILFIVALLFVTALINSKLDAPQYYDNYMFTDSSGSAAAGRELNPQYLSGTKRAIYQFFLDFLPTGQGIEISSHSTPHLWLMPLYSLFITLGATVSGVLCFRKKDLK